MQHLQEANQSYFTHWKNSMSYFCKSIKASFFFFVHAFFACLFTHSGSETVAELQLALTRNAAIA